MCVAAFAFTATTLVQIAAAVKLLNATQLVRKFKTVSY